MFWASKMLDISHGSPSHSILVCFQSPCFCTCSFIISRHRDSVHAFSLCCCCHMPFDSVCHLIMTVQLFCLFLPAVSSWSWFCFILFFYLIFLCSSPDCMLVSQATFQSKHYSFFCSSDISVPTFPLPHLLSCELLCANVWTVFATLLPETSLFLCTLQPLQGPSVPAVIADGCFFKQKTPYDWLHTLPFLSCPVLFPFLVICNVANSRFLKICIKFRTHTVYVNKVRIKILLLKFKEAKNVETKYK